MIYVLTAANAVMLGLVVYFFFTFRQALDSSGVKQIDDYLHELEGSVAQLTEEFERSSSRISKELLRKTSELQALIGECDAKLAQVGKPSVQPPARPQQPAQPVNQPSSSVAEPPVKAIGMPSVPAAVAARRLSAADLLGTEAQKPRPPAEQPPTAPPTPTAGGQGEQRAGVRCRKRHRTGCGREPARRVA